MQGKTTNSGTVCRCLNLLIMEIFPLVSQFSDWSDAQLLAKFIEICLEKDRAEMEGRTGKFNRLFTQKIAIVDSLRSRLGDHRLLLTSLYEHQNLRVRLNAARATLAVAPLQARQVLEQLRDWGYPPYDADARETLRALETGFFVPT